MYLHIKSIKIKELYAITYKLLIFPNLYVFTYNRMVLKLLKVRVKTIIKLCA
jgi:hypothetical protein